MENKKLQSVLENWQKIQPLSEKDREKLSKRFTIDFNYNSNHIEGNTLTYGQTELLWVRPSGAQIWGDSELVSGLAKVKVRVAPSCLTL